MNETSQTVIKIDELTRDFGKTRALNRVSMDISKGTVFGLVGANGAGKTTLIKHVMGQLRARTGAVSVLGFNPVTNPVEVLSRIGYLSEANDLPEWMSVQELINFTRPFYSNWDEGYAESLRKTFELDPGSKVKQMSKGQKARLGLLLALAFRADVLVLDEPSSGLDPLVRRDILRAVIKTISDEGRTVLFSSHLLDEVERVADQVAIIEQGSVLENDSLDNLKGRFHKLSVQFKGEMELPPELNGCSGWQGNGRHWSTYYHGRLDEFRTVIEREDISILDQQIPTLNEIFVALVGDSHSGQGVGI